MARLWNTAVAATSELSFPSPIHSKGHASFSMATDPASQLNGKNPFWTTQEDHC